MSRNAPCAPGTVIVGAGLSGLLTACFVARSGRRVTVFDRNIGGRAKSIDLAGVPVNPGPRAVYRRGHLEKALRSLGIAPRGFVPPAHGGFALVGGSLCDLPGTPASLLSTALLREPGARREAALLLARIGIGALDVVPSTEGGESIGAWLNRHAQTEGARGLVSALCRVATYLPVGFGADDADAGLVLRNVRSALMGGVTYVDGGWSSIVLALVNKAVSFGVVFDERAVVAVSRGSGADVVGLADGSTVAADHVVVAGSPATAHDLLGADTGPESRRVNGQEAGDEAPAEKRPTSTPVFASCLDLVLDTLPVPARRFVLGIDAPLYFSVHTPPSQASPVVVHVARYGGGADRNDLEAFVDVVQPGWRERVRGARFLPKMLVMHRMPRAGQRRPDVAAAVDLDGRCFVVGDHVGDGLIADAAASSAVQVAAAIAAPARARAA